MKNRKAYVVAPSRIEIMEEELPKLRDSEVLLKTISVGMCHTDLPAFLGVMGTSVSKYGYARLGVGEEAYPTAPGHEPVAKVVEVGKDVKNFKVGQVVGGFGGGYADYIVIEDTNRMYCEIPQGIKPVKYCCAEPLGCIVNIVREASCEYGETVAVVGCGFMGLMIIAGLRKSGAKKIVAIDLLDNKLEIAQKYGATDVLNPLKCGEIDDAAYELTDGHFFDVVVEITGSLKGLETAGKIIRWTHREPMSVFDGSYRGPGKILLPSVYSKQEPFPTSLAFNLMDRTPLLVPTHPTYSTRPRENMQEGIASYMDGRLPCDDFISHEFKFEDTQKAFEMLAHPDPSYLKGIVTFD